MSPTLSVSGVAALHGLSAKTVRRAIHDGHLKAEKLPGATGPYLLQPKHVDAWLAKRAETGIDVTPGSSGYFRMLAKLDELPALIQKHHAITADLPLADVVVACKCSPDVERDTLAWALHLRDVMSGATETSGAVAS